METFRHYILMRHAILLLFMTCSLLMTAQPTTDAQGRKQGYWKKTDGKGKLVYEGLFKDDKPVGRFKYYYPFDSVRAIMDFQPDGKTAYARLFHPNGKRMGEGKYINKEMKDSTWTYYDELGVLISRENYKAGKKEGASVVYLPDGSVSEEYQYKNDLQDGPFTQYFTGNIIKGKGVYVKGKLEGRVVYYYPNGVEVASGVYKNGEKNGPWIYKTESGQIREKELYKNGIQASPKETEAFFAKNKATGENKAAGSAPPAQKQPQKQPQKR